MKKETKKAKFENFKHYGRGIPLLKIINKQGFCDVEWDEGGLKDPTLFFIALDSMSMVSELATSYKGGISLLNDSDNDFSLGRRGVIRNFPLMLADQTFAIVERYFNAALNLMLISGLPRNRESLEYQEYSNIKNKIIYFSSSL